MIDDPGTRPVVNNRCANLRAKLIDDHRRPDTDRAVSKTYM